MRRASIESPVLIGLALLIALMIGTRDCSADRLTGTRRALIVCGLPGNEEFREQFVDSVSRIRSTLIERLGFEDTNVRIQFGRSDEEPEVRGFPAAGRATREEIVAEAKILVRDTGPTDIAWIFVIGHSFFDDRTAFLNIPDTDISHRQFSKLFEQLGGTSGVFHLYTGQRLLYQVSLPAKPHRNNFDRGRYRDECFDLPHGAGQMR